MLKEGYSATAPDLSALVTKLKRGRPDVIFHTGYNPDITLFLRQAREQGLRFSALIGHGAGYGVYDKLKEALGRDVNYFFNVDPISIWLTNEKSLRAPLPAMIKMVGEEYEKARPGTQVRVRARGHVGEQHVRVHDRGVAARHQEVRRASTPRRCARRRSRSICRRAARCSGSV